MNRVKTLLAAGLGLAMAFTISCSSDDGEEGGGDCGAVTIGTQTWKKCNSNVAPSVGNSVCYDNKSENCAKYGRLYDWEAAKSVCSGGWHLPSDDEWTTLTDYIGSSTAGTKLKATSGWSNNGNGTDDYGFSALPSGQGNSGGFGSVGLGGFWWSATESNASYAWYRNMGFSKATVDRVNLGKSTLFSVRCIKG
jgi:uncharacterized protein (TIGR02145 family)